MQTGLSAPPKVDCVRSSSGQGSHDSLDLSTDAHRAEGFNELPAELVGEILLEAWLAVPMFDPLKRWALFSKLCLVNHTFRELAIWLAIRHVRVLGHCSMDVLAYRSIGKQYLALHLSARPPESPGSGPEDTLKAVFQYSTVQLDITYATYWAWRDRDKWLKDDVDPGRPDDVYGIHFDLFASPFGEYTYPYPERREAEYLDWLSRRRRDRLSGWFADLLGAVPDCAEVVVSADERVERFTVAAYSTLLESLWWWKSLASVHLLIVPGPPSFFAEMTGTTRGPSPPLPALASVKQLRLSKYPACSCKSPYLRETHLPDCISRRMLLPFPGLRTLLLDTKPEPPEDVFLPPDVQCEVILNTESSDEAKPAWSVDESAIDSDSAIFIFGDRTPPSLWVPWLHISRSDALWETIDPVCIYRYQAQVKGD
ncbi:hypothetical protein BD414DRAFT_497894 [Trametes punicea]|nr:hypothetical protein BD414DRAFT_497894 [Trametes punicea]